MFSKDCSVLVKRRLRINTRSLRDSSCSTLCWPFPLLRPLCSCLSAILLLLLLRMYMKTLSPKNKRLSGPHAALRVGQRSVSSGPAAVHGAPPVRQHRNFPLVARLGRGLREAHLAGSTCYIMYCIVLYSGKISGKRCPANLFQRQILYCTVFVLV